MEIYRYSAKNGKNENIKHMEPHHFLNALRKEQASGKNPALVAAMEALEPIMRQKAAEMDALAAARKQAILSFAH